MIRLNPDRERERERERDRQTDRERERERERKKEKEREKERERKRERKRERERGNTTRGFPVDAAGNFQFRVRLLRPRGMVRLQAFRKGPLNIPI